MLTDRPRTGRAGNGSAVFIHLCHNALQVASFRQLGGTGKGPLEYGDLFILTIPDQGPVKV